MAGQRHIVFDLPKRELSMTVSVKQELRRLADALPENPVYDDVIEESRFRRVVEAGDLRR
jgi:hypothetical protein